MKNKKAKISDSKKDVSAEAINNTSNSLSKKDDKFKEELKQQDTKTLSKKQKKLNAFIKKQLAKEEKVELLERLSKTNFTSNLMLSSKELGKSKMTTREKLRYAMNQQKAGIPISDKTVRLVVEKEIEEKDKDEEEKSKTALENYAKSTLELANSLDPSVQRKIQISKGSALKTGTLINSIPTRVRSKKKSMVSVRELLKRSNPELDSDDLDDSDSDSDSESDQDSDNSEQGETRSMVDETNKKSIDNNPTTSLTYLKAPTLKPSKPQNPIIPNIKPITNASSSLDGNKFYVNVERPERIQAARLKLPICGEEQIIMEAINKNDAVIICGETGSGKTTQLPQFLFESGYGHPDSPNPGIIGVTQPRRVAAVSMANRVATELCVNSDTVSYQIRYDTTTSKLTKIKFMTDGVLLREVSQDFTLSKYSALILDEAHERTLNTDILIGVLSRAVKLRNTFFRQGKKDVKPLKLIIMSATLRVEDFVNNRNLFSQDSIPPVIKVDSRQYPVTIHFNKRTPQFDYVGEAFKKAVKIHTRLPYGGILIFLTGQNEIQDLCRRLKKRFPALKNVVEKEGVEDVESKLKGNIAIEDEDLEAIDNTDDVDLRAESEEDEFTDSEEELEGDEIEHLELSEEASDDPMYVLPLYSMLPTKQQLKIFEDPPEGHRFCVVATNVAETSLTIPNIRYVIDCGKAKEKTFDIKTNISSFKVDWISKASADQRAGRAGRTGPGHCYRLYSSAVFNDQFEQFSEAEIFRSPIEGVVLQLKSMNLDNVVNFPFPTPPDANSVRQAERLLSYLGAIDSNTKKINPLGTLMSMFPISPRFAKMLSIGQQHECMPYVIAIVAALSVGDPFLKEHQALGVDEEEENENDEATTTHKRKFYQALAKFTGKSPTSDLLRILNVVGAFEYSGGGEDFCHDNFVRPKAMEEIRKMRRQLTNLVQLFCPSVNVSLDPKLPPPSSAQNIALRQIISAGFVDQVAVLKKIVCKNSNENDKAYKKGITSTPAYKIMWGEEDVYIHPTSCLYLHSPPFEFVTYSHLSKTSSGIVMMQGVTAIDPKWLINIAKPLVTFSKPLQDRNPIEKLKTAIASVKEHGTVDEIITVTPSFGPKSWPLPNQRLARSELKK